MVFDFKKLKFSTKQLIAFVLGLGSLLQIPQVSAPVFAFGKLHPHFASAIAVLLGVVTLLHNPQVEDFLGIHQTEADPNTGVVTDTTVVVKKEE